MIEVKPWDQRTHEEKIQRLTGIAVDFDFQTDTAQQEWSEAIGNAKEAWRDVGRMKDDPNYDPRK